MAELAKPSAMEKVDIYACEQVLQDILKNAEKRTMYEYVRCSADRLVSFVRDELAPGPHGCDTLPAPQRCGECAARELGQAYWLDGMHRCGLSGVPRCSLSSCGEAST